MYFDKSHRINNFFMKASKKEKQNAKMYAKNSFIH